MVDRAYQTDECYERTPAQKAGEQFQRPQSKILGAVTELSRSAVSGAGCGFVWSAGNINIMLHAKACSNAWKPHETVSLRSNYVMAVTYHKRQLNCATSALLCAAALVLHLAYCLLPAYD